MSDQFLAEIRIFPFNFAPSGWALCDGQLLSISQNTALFALLGTTYGGDGRVTFGLPNLQGAAPMQQGQGQGLSLRTLGEMAGEDAVTLLQSEMPLHNHFMMAHSGAGANANVSNAALATTSWASGTSIGKVNVYSTTVPADTLMSQTLAINGGDQPHNNLQPYLTLNFCIALQGIFPQRP
jgi:microcystin-dependent protein